MRAVPFAVSAKSRLTRHDLGRFPSDTLFDRLARAVCAAEVLPRKELYEAWEVARRTRRVCRGGRVVDVAGGHGLLAHVMLVLDHTSGDAHVVDPSSPPSAAALHEALTAVWPRLAKRVHLHAQPIAGFDLSSDDVVVSSHACGALTDAVLDSALAAGARVAVLPCCHDAKTCDAGALTGWVDAPLAIDLRRAARLEQRSYRVWTQTIPAAITPKNRLLIGVPGAANSPPPARHPGQNSPMIRTALATLALLLAGTSSWAQTVPASVMSGAEVLTQLQQAARTSPEMMVARMTTTDTYRVNVVKRTAPQGAIAHDVGTEVHYIINGTATLVTGGTIVRPSGSGAAAAGAATILDGQTRTVHAGDVVLVPVHTPHWYSHIESPLTYLEVRFDVR